MIQNHFHIALHALRSKKYSSLKELAEDYDTIDDAIIGKLKRRKRRKVYIPMDINPI